jgi:hypothetical protein
MKKNYLELISINSSPIESTRARPNLVLIKGEGKQIRRNHLRLVVNNENGWTPPVYDLTQQSHSIKIEDQSKINIMTTAMITCSFLAAYFTLSLFKF